MDGSEVVDDRTISRRSAIKRLGAGAAVVWTAPVIMSVGDRAFAAPVGSAPPGAKTSTVYNSTPFACPTGASDTSVPVGTVVLSLVAQKITAVANVSGLITGDTYDIWLNQDPGGCPLPGPTGSLLAGPGGIGIGTDSETVIAGATNFWISVTGPGIGVYRSVAVTLP